MYCVRLTFAYAPVILVGEGGDCVRVYLDVVMLLNFVVDFLLLLGTNRLCGFPYGAGKAALAAALGGLYAGICLLPGYRFLGDILWRCVCLCGMGMIAFGWSWSALRRCTVFLLLSMALGGIALGLGNGEFMSLILSSGAVCLMCAVGFRGYVGGREYVPVVLEYKKKKISLMALRDTGNTLTDPITGQSVLITGPVVAQSLLGLSIAQLHDPVGTLASGAISGLRLIPYRSVGQSNGMLLALRLEVVRIGKWQGSKLVAFSPEGLDSEGTYQALTGGVV